MTIDLEALRLLGWVMLGVMVIGLALFEGLSIGVTLLLPVLSIDNIQRHHVSKLIAPVSLGNLAWLVVTLTVLFAAWPIAYAVCLASLYWLILPILLTLLCRPLALYFLSTCDQPFWQKYAPKLLTASGVVPAVLFGLIVGNLLKGIPFHLDSDMRILFLGDVWGLFNLFSLLVAATCVALLALHGAVYVQLKADADLVPRAKAISLRAGVLFVVLFAMAGLWIMHLEGYHISSEILSNGPSNPLAKFVKRGEGLWLDNYEHLPMLWSVPLLAFIAAIISIILSVQDKAYWAMLASSLCVTMVVLTWGASMFPFLLPSNISLNSSLAIWDSSASQLTLQAVEWLALFALPLMFIVGRWVFRLFALQPFRVTIAESDA
jgi:cytochrome d ubiquinol oxidase subunit II